MPGIERTRRVDSQSVFSPGQLKEDSRATSLQPLERQSAVQKDDMNIACHLMYFGSLSLAPPPSLPLSLSPPTSASLSVSPCLEKTFALWKLLPSWLCPDNSFSSAPDQRFLNTRSLFSSRSCDWSTPAACDAP
ncbi:hypothetical protein TcWFU_008473 [Taenia crassiceps]|uniref:Uncharacterized protein n=1 Tax=Taenia crassiceps TaxID=6207 RepID=A0ABR4QAW4_9CEST